MIRIGRERGSQDHGRFIRGLDNHSHGLCQHDFSIDALLQVVRTVFDGPRHALNPVQGV
jgi:hypothetical protein